MLEALLAFSLQATLCDWVTEQSHAGHQCMSGRVFNSTKAESRSEVQIPSQIASQSYYMVLAPTVVCALRDVLHHSGPGC